MITWGTFLRAIFNAMEREPDNNMVNHHVVACMRDFYNAWHRGSPTNFLGALSSIAEVGVAVAVCRSAYPLRRGAMQ